MSGEPILIRCEGSGCPPAAMTQGMTMGTGICTMCGQPWTVIAGVVLDHRRDDIIARLQRGDFNGKGTPDPHPKPQPPPPPPPPDPKGQAS